MTRRLGTWMLGYGAFLVAAGVAGFLSNPERAATALLSGGTFGALSIVWGALLRRGVGWARWGALATSGFLAAIFAWRASASWIAFGGGQSGKLFAAALITTMGIASLLTAYVLVSARPGERLGAGAPAR